MNAPTPITLLELNSRITGLLNSSPGLRDVWVVAETSDVRRAGPHCYMQLLEKDPLSGECLASSRATIWRSQLAAIDRKFFEATGSRLESNQKVMLRVSVAYHPQYGLSLNVSDIYPEFTLGDLIRRRRQIVEQLRKEGILELNKQLGWPRTPWRIAVISAPGAAGYGDFINQLFTNARNLRFAVELFPAVMQGDRTVASVISALEAVAQRLEDFDCVVIIRGGGATADLASFDSYELAANVAMFPVPVIVGIGHERDETVLDYVANMRVKTPTAAAEWLIGRGEALLDELNRAGGLLLDIVSTRLAASHRRLAAITGELPALSQNVIASARFKIGPQAQDTIENALKFIISRRKDRLDSLSTLLDTLTPQATLRRGFSITRVNGHAVSSSADIQPGDVISTTLADGLISSIAK